MQMSDRFSAPKAVVFLDRLMRSRPELFDLADDIGTIRPRLTNNKKGVV